MFTGIQNEENNKINESTYKKMLQFDAKLITV